MTEFQAPKGVPDYLPPESGQFVAVRDGLLDAEVIAVADGGFRSLGLDGFRLEITSLGDDTCRPQYRELLVEFLAKVDLDEETRRRAEINPLRVLDDKRPEVQARLEDAPLMVDHLSDATKAHYDAVRQYLTDLGVTWTEAPRLVRGLDYYTKTTFEFVHPGLGAQSAIGGGGRYDGLSAALGGPDVSGIGYAVGVDRTLLAVQLVGRLREAGIPADTVYGDRGLKGAMKAADRSGASHAVVIGERDLAEGVGQLRDLRSGEQTAVPVGELFERLRATVGS